MLDRKERKQRKRLIKRAQELFELKGKPTFFSDYFAQDYKATMEEIKRLDIISIRRELKGRYKLP
jgi:hypothetical protein